MILIVLLTIMTGLGFAEELQLPFQYDAALYFEPGEGSYLKLRIGIAYDDLLFLSKGDLFSATYAVSYRITSSEGKRIHSSRVTGTVEVEDFSETNKRSISAQEEISIPLEAGTYTVRVVAEDQENRRRGVREEEVVVSEAESGDMQLSSLVLTGCGIPNQTLSDTLPTQCVMFRILAEVYLPSDSTAGSAIPVLVEIRDDRDDLEREIKESVYVADEITQIEIPVSVELLKPGSYSLILTVGDDLARMQRLFVIPWSIMSMAAEKDDAVRLLTYVADNDIVKAFKKTPEEERRQFWIQYWTEKDPIPSTPWNELVQFYERRIRYANEQFHSFDDGWKTDMGMIHVMFGHPDDIERHPFDIESKPYQIWTYYSLGRQFIFVDRNGFGRYDLVSGDYSRR